MKLPLFPLLTIAMSISAAVPPTEKKPVTDEYHGVKVVDEYRWLEDGDSAAVKAWTAAQNQYSRAWLDSRRDRAEIESKLKVLYAQDTPSHTGLVPKHLGLQKANSVRDTIKAIESSTDTPTLIKLH